MSAELLIRTKGIHCDVQRPSITKDNSGFPVPTWNLHLGNISVFVQPASGSEAIRYGRESNRKFHLAYTLTKYDIQPKDRLTGGKLGTRLLDIQSVRTAGEFGTGPLSHQVLECEETD